MSTIKTLYDLHKAIFDYVKTSHKQVKKQYEDIQSFYANIDVSKLTLSEEQLKNKGFMLDDKIIIFMTFLTTTKDKLRNYADFITEIKNMLDKKSVGIYEKADYILKKSNVFGGSNKDEYFESFHGVYEQYMTSYLQCKYLDITANKKALRDHENKFENLIIIYAYINDLLKILLEYIYSIAKLILHCIIIGTFVLLTKFKNYITSVIHGKNTKEKIAKYLKNIHDIWFVGVSEFKASIKNETPLMYEEINEFERFLNNAIDKSKLTLNDIIHSAVKSTLPNKYKNVVKLDKKIKSIIDEKVNGSASDAFNMANMIQTDIVVFLNEKYNYNDAKKEDELLDVIHNAIINFSATKVANATKFSSVSNMTNANTVSVAKASSTSVAKASNSLLRRMH